ncbi:helix-turn-helix domain-containing protein [Epilithonimonas sp. UC225_85]|uniref:helix-turn-helix domain-containing protein n=1 Tax=Epilithonimonas sp. UC225_85 TaxID=3350167 RepID=UPI0036D35CA6
MQRNKERGLFSFLIFIIITFYSQISAQNPEEYNKIYTKTYLEVSQKDFTKALKIADSLFNISETPRFQAKSLMLSASLLQQVGEITEAVNFASKAETILKDSEDYIWKAKISGFLASQYRQLKLVKESKKYINQTLESIAKINDPRIVNQTMGFVMQEKAYYEIEMKDYRKSISFVKEANRYFDLSGQTNPFLMANNDQLLGLNYYHLKDDDKALVYYNQALEKLVQMPDNYLKALVLNGIAQVYISKKNAEKAKKYIDESQSLAKESKYLSLKKEIYSTSQQYYALVNDIKNLQETKLKQDSVVEKIEDKSSKFISDSYSGLKNRNEIIQKETENKSIILEIALLILFCGIVYFLIYRNRQKKNFETIKKILDETKQSKVIESEMPVIDFENDDPAGYHIDAAVETVENQSMMTPATKKKILIKLDKFEQSKLFIKSAVSLPYLASYCSTNTKYLSYVLNNYKKKDFTNYINELRIGYIIEKLSSDPQYHKYKISTLAEEAGFSSQSKFAAAFRKVTSVSPSQFLEHLKAK